MDQHVVAAIILSGQTIPGAGAPLPQPSTLHDGLLPIPVSRRSMSLHHESIVTLSSVGAGAADASHGGHRPGELHRRRAITRRPPP